MAFINIEHHPDMEKAVRALKEISGEAVPCHSIKPNKQFNDTSSKLEKGKFGIVDPVSFLQKLAQSIHTKGASESKRLLQARPSTFGNIKTGLSLSASFSSKKRAEKLDKANLKLATNPNFVEIITPYTQAVELASIQFKDVRKNLESQSLGCNLVHFTLQKSR